MRRSCTRCALVMLVLAVTMLASCRLLLPAPVGPWQVTVVSAEATDEWDEFYVEPDSENYIVVLTVDIRNLRNTSVQFAPETVVLAHTGPEETGWAQTPALHTTNDSTLITDFWEDSVVYELAAGQTRTDTFVYEFPRGFTEFDLYFPESVGLPVSLQ